MSNSTRSASDATKLKLTEHNGSKYTLLSVIAQGAYGMVTRGITSPPVSRQRVAIKSPRVKGSESSLVTEILLHEALGTHANIVQVLEVIESSSIAGLAESSSSHETSSDSELYSSNGLLPSRGNCDGATGGETQSEWSSTSKCSKSSSDRRFSPVNTVHIVFELCEMDLATYIKTKPVEIRSVHYEKFVRDITSAVQYIHDKEIVHRDIKPNNILLQWGQDPFGPPIFKLADFGIGSFLLSSGKDLRLDLSCFPYSSPDQLLLRHYTISLRRPPNRLILKASDIWAVGVCAMELILGVPVLPHATEYMTISYLCQSVSFKYEPKRNSLLKLRLINEDKFFMRSVGSMCCLDVAKRLGSSCKLLKPENIKELESFLFYAPAIRLSNFRVATEAYGVGKDAEEVHRPRRRLSAGEIYFMTHLRRILNLLGRHRSAVYIVYEFAAASAVILTQLELCATAVLAIRLLSDYVKSRDVRTLLDMLGCNIGVCGVESLEKALIERSIARAAFSNIRRGVRLWTKTHKTTKSIQEWIHTL